MGKRVKLLCPCLFGLESVLSFEVRKLGGENITVTDGRVTFEGDLSLVAQANLWLRTAERVGIVLGEFPAESFSELFDRTAALPWEDYIGEDGQFPVKGWSVNSKLHSVPDCQSIVKRAIVRRLEGVYHRQWFNETGPVYQVQFTPSTGTGRPCCWIPPAPACINGATGPTPTRPPSKRRWRRALWTWPGCGGIRWSATPCAARAPW